MIDRVESSSITDQEKAPEAGGIGPSDRLKSSRNLRFRWAVNIGYAILLVVLALLPSTVRLSELAISDWFAHAAAYGIQAALVYWASRPSLGPNRALAVGVLAASGFGVLTEGLQLLQPGRSVEFKDLVANTIGALLACVIIAGVSRFGTGAER